MFDLLPNKRKESYNLVFSKIKSWIDVVSQNWQFEAYLSDFEKGAFLAAVEVFPGIASEGCFFHLSKRLDYHVKSLGLMQKYKDDTDFRIRVKKLAALAFIPVADVIPAFESLSTHFLQDELPLLAYFEKTWIGTPVGATRRLTPDLPIQMWNALERSAAGSTRTTNALEAYHQSPRLQRADILPAPICMEVPGLPEEPAGSHSQHNATHPERLLLQTETN